MAEIAATKAGAGLESMVQAGILVGAMAITFSISYASLVTTAQAPQATAALVGMTLTGTAVLCLFMGLFSSVKGLVPISQDVPAADLGAMVLTMA